MAKQRAETTDPVREDFDAIAEEYARQHRGSDHRRAARLRDDMIRTALPLAERLARRYRGGAEPLADLEQVARLGLVKAVDRYNPERGSFTAYAVNTILGELKRHLRDHAWGLHVPRRMQELVLLVTQTDAELTRRWGRRPADAEIAAAAGMAVEQVDRVRTASAAFRPISFSRPIGEGEVQLSDVIGEPDGELESAADRLTVATLLARLPERERRVVLTTFYGGRTQAQIAAELGVSQMQVSRILSRVLCWMREGLLTDQVPRWPVGADELEEPFRVTAALHPGGELEITVAGEVDRDNADRLSTRLLELIRRQPAGNRVTVRLDEVPLLDAAGVRVLLAVYEAGRVRGVTVTAAGMSSFVRRIATIAGLGPMLEG
ncbi:RNA polymerase sigma-B factor [Actinoplanes octamycinicus]|uniref:RNA polymerase sigma-B factor n=1 Tax=Actinoplanes octamycinicus TaxID=135948 RepID=A0A7W7H0J9_9ACTN|nr:sigma-70 family RNA polymerase sigma factor [Actinoplanes octamycinicus]MBB4741713.1 RNA polymerase sigma-B factor [Actinoplanes octamycinicus]